MSVNIEDLAHELSVLKNNFKEYTIGQTYNGVLATITNGGGWAWTAVSGSLTPYKTLTGNWLRFDFSIQTTSDVSASGIFNFSGGFTFVNNIAAAISEHWTGGVTRTNAHVVASQNYVTAFCSSTQSSIFDFFCVAKISSWPTWADVV